MPGRRESGSRPRASTRVRARQRQPRDPSPRRTRPHPLVPSGSIHATPGDAAALQAATATFPVPVPGVARAEGGGPPALFLGLTSSKAFGAASYLLLRPEGNIMVDSCRFNPALARTLKEVGVKWIFLTHRDDVADHARWAAAMGAPRILHADECRAEQGTE